MADRSFVGVDGCRGGWVACPSNGPIRLFPGFAELVDSYPGATFLVDIPQGLTQAVERDLESVIRARLPGQTSSVFPVPSREAVYADSFEEACRINKRNHGKKLSLQAWYICPKIREVDQALLRTPSWQRRIYESHPELCFRGMSDGRILAPKKTKEGQSERLGLLREHIDADAVFEQAVADYPRKLVAKDDILDAMVLMLVAAAGYVLLRGDVRRDEKGLAIRLACPRQL